MELHGLLVGDRHQQALDGACSSRGCFSCVYWYLLSGVTCLLGAAVLSFPLCRCGVSWCGASRRMF